VKSERSLFGLGLVFLSVISSRAVFADDFTNLVGAFQSVEPVGITITVDQSSRVTSNFHLVGADGSYAPVAFPHRLKLDPARQIYVTTGVLQTTYSGPLGVKTCFSPVPLEMDYYDDDNAIDVNFIYPTRVTLDAMGNCVASAYQTMPAGFERTR